MDYYKTLGIERNASEKDIKKSYHKLALQFHPDKNKEPLAEKKFKEISEAYEILSNEQKRKKYDMFGCNAELGVTMDPFDLFNGLFKNDNFFSSDLFMKTNHSFGIHSFPTNNSFSRSTSVIFRDGKKITRTTITENGNTRVEEKIEPIRNNHYVLQ